MSSATLFAYCLPVTRSLRGSWHHDDVEGSESQKSASESQTPIDVYSGDEGAHPFFLESTSIFQDPCPTLNGTRHATMPQVLTRRREPIHPSSQARSPAPTNPRLSELALVVITQEAEAHSFTVRSHLVLSLKVRIRNLHEGR